MPEDISHLVKRFQALQKQVADFRIVGAGGIDVQGSFAHGFAVNASPTEQPSSSTPTPPPTVCEGDFEGDYTGPDEALQDIIVGLPYDITILWFEVSGDFTLANTAILYGDEGEAANVLMDYVEVTDSVLRYEGLSQVVHAGGYLQLNIGDWSDADLVDGHIHYKVHYTYNCADAP